jgi:hypothetical protein
MTISPGWANLAESWIGNPQGRHCHWCSHVKHEDGASYCENPKSKFCDGDRIRSWDGETCASECDQFALDPWYQDDANIEKYFGEDRPTAPNADVGGEA